MNLDEMQERTPGGFAVVKDGSECPDAVFAQIEPAIDWGLLAHGIGRFRIRWVRFESLQLDQAPQYQYRPAAA